MQPDPANDGLSPTGGGTSSLCIFLAPLNEGGEWAVGAYCHGAVLAGWNESNRSMDGEKGGIKIEIKKERKISTVCHVQN